MMVLRDNIEAGGDIVESIVDHIEAVLMVLVPRNSGKIPILGQPGFHSFDSRASPYLVFSYYFLAIYSFAGVKESREAR